jgi:Na+/glutamate symporter
MMLPITGEVRNTHNSPTWGTNILCVSIARLLGNVTSVVHLPRKLPIFVIAVFIGAVIGTRLGVSKLDPRRLLQALGMAAAKLALT